jgi:iduronate 2-sulfatase
MKFPSNFALFGLGCLILTASVPRAATPPARPNILFIAIDDLRNDLGALGVPYARTPNLDRLAASGRLFTNHYAVVPTCGASRCALMRGNYPDQPAQVTNDATLKTHASWAAHSMPAWWRAHGYQTLSLGKITHYPGNLTGKNWAVGPEELPGAWDRAWIPDSPWKNAESIMHGFANGRPRVAGKSPPWEAFDGPDNSYPDFWVAGEAVSTLQRLAKSHQPWFFGVGFFKPHLPFAAPKKWFDLHADDDIPPPVVSTRPPEPSSWHPSNEFRRNYGHENGRDPDTDPAYAKELRHAYVAATSYVDAQVGKVLAALHDLGLDDNTIVVVWGDHGFLLGEHAIWGKHSLYENALRSPLIVRAPGLAQPGEASHALVETVDIFPTLLDLCGLPAPGAFAGRSLRPQLDHPAAPTAKPARGFWSAGERTIRTDRWRLISHLKKAGHEAGVELFDMIADPHEARNVAAAEPAVVKDLLAQLEQVPSPFAAKPAAGGN